MACPRGGVKDDSETLRSSAFGTLLTGTYVHVHARELIGNP